MPRVQFNVQKSDNKTAWGYAIEQTEEGMFGEVPEDLIEIEIAAGRVKVVAQPKEVERSAQDVIENGSGKRLGRPAKVAEPIKVEE